MKNFYLIVISVFMIVLIGCDRSSSQESKDAAVVDRQQAQYAKGQPIPAFDWSLERHLISELYKLRNKKVATHAVWRSDYGIVEGDCPSLGYGLPYDTSLTNPLKGVVVDFPNTTGYHTFTVEQPEPNGIFASKNTAATWVMCVGGAGSIEPVYIESKVTIYPGPVKVNYKTNRVRRSGKATVNIKSN